MAKAILTAARLREVANYNPDTGIFTWRIRIATNRAVGSRAGRIVASGHWRINIDGKTYLAHRLAWLYVYGVWPAHDIDHINGIRLDNRICNLRDVPRSINVQNLRVARSDNKSSGLLGVSRGDPGWVAKIQISGKKKYLGQFATPELAHAAYIAAKRELHKGCTI